MAEMVTCACGCGQQGSATTTEGKARRFIRGHNVGAGSDHPNWTGGRQSVKGYIAVYAPDHPRANNGYVYEHLLVAERAMGKVVPPSAEVHHVNGIKSDNRPRNLVVCEDTAYHCLLHARQRALDAYGDPTARRCWVCRCWDVDSDSFTVTIGGSSYHKACAAEYVRLKRRMDGSEALRRIRRRASVDLRAIAREIGA